MPVLWCFEGMVEGYFVKNVDHQRSWDDVVAGVITIDESCNALDECANVLSAVISGGFRSFIPSVSVLNTFPSE